MNLSKMNVSKNRNLSFQVVLLGALVVGLSACKKNQLGGKSEVSGTVAHHDTPIPHSRVFIKYNATEFPGKDTSLYDAQVHADAAGKFSFNVYKGSYYLFGYGYDNNIQEIVYGGIPLEVKRKENKNVSLPVTEE
jgi:hypothetical protein